MTLQGPPLYEDELITSGLARCCRRFLIAGGRFGTDVLGLANWQPRFLTVAALPRISEVFRQSPEYLLFNHSVFPYAAAFLDEATYDNTIGSLRSGGRLSSLGVILQNATVGRGYRRFCPACAKEEQAQVGESYWHRAHNVPGAIACASHQAYLRETPLPIGMASRLALELPHECSGRTMGRGKPSEAVLKIAYRSVEALTSTPSGRLGRRKAQYYRAVALEGDWIGPSCEFDQTRLSELVRKTFGQDLLDKWCLAAAGSSVLKWPALMVRDATAVPFIPLKHILLDIALGRQREEHESRLSHKSSGPSGTRDEIKDLQCTTHARRELRRLSRTSTPPLTTEDFLSRIGAWQAYRHRRDALPKLRAVVLQFRSSKLSVKQLAPGRMLYRSHPDEVIPAQR